MLPDVEIAGPGHHCFEYQRNQARFLRLESRVARLHPLRAQFAQRAKLAQRIDLRPLLQRPDHLDDRNRIGLDGLDAKRTHSTIFEYGLAPRPVACHFFQ